VALLASTSAQLKAFTASKALTYNRCLPAITAKAVNSYPVNTDLGPTAMPHAIPSRTLTSWVGRTAVSVALTFALLGYSESAQASSAPSGTAAAAPLSVAYSATAPTIDGTNLDDAIWQQATWQPMPYLMAGTKPASSDFAGRYRLLWDEQYLYLQAEIVDDVLWDSRPNPLEAYWDDDALEVFIDSDASGGKHFDNHSALAYHVALDNQAVDIGDDGKPHLYNAHVKSAWQRVASNNPEAPYPIIWELAIRLYPNNYTDAKPLAPLTLQANQTIGFMLAYCDNDGSDVSTGKAPSQSVREHFMGSHFIQPVNGDSNRGYLDASVFGKLRLSK